MWVLLSVLMFTPTGRAIKLADLQGKWTVGLEMDGLFDFDQYSILWRPLKTVMIGIEGYATFGKYNEEKMFKKGKRRRCKPREDDEGWSGSMSIWFYKYFRAHNSFSPFIALSAKAYRANIDPGVECFFNLFGKQLSLRFKTSLVSVSRTYNEETNSYIEDKVNFYLPTGGYLSTWLCFHF